MEPFKPRGVFLQPIPEKWAGNMQSYTKYIAISLTLVGITFYLATYFINTITTDYNALIPIIIAIPLFLTALLSEKLPAKKSFFMHIAVGFGVICISTGTLGLVSLINGDFSIATGEQVILFIIGFDYTTNCIRSFIHARSV
jgi:hypothetical protein